MHYILQNSLRDQVWSMYVAPETTANLGYTLHKCINLNVLSDT